MSLSFTQWVTWWRDIFLLPSSHLCNVTSSTHWEGKGSGRGGSELSLITLPYTSNVSSFLLRVYIYITVICIYVQNFPEHIKLGHFITIIIGCALYKRCGLTTSSCYPRQRCVLSNRPILLTSSGSSYSHFALYKMASIEMLTNWTY